MQSLLKLAKPNELSSLFGLKFKTNEATVKAVVESISNSINVNISKINDNYQGKIQFNCQPVDFRNLLDLPEGFVFSEKDASLHWMDWLLNKGLQTIVYGYSYVPGRGFGRSGGGKMAEGGFFRVPPQYSGTSQNNFVTRAFKSREREITSILQELFKWA
jgi:hypothetical protein